MTVSLELDRAARARGLASRFVPTGQTGIAIAGWGIAVDAVVSDFIAGAAERLVVEGARARRRAALGRGPGLAHASGVLGRHARARARLGAARLRALPPWPGTTEVDGYPGHPLLSLPELVELHERISLSLAQGEGGRDRPEHAASSTTRRRGRPSRSRRRDRPRGGRSGPLRGRPAARRRVGRAPLTANTCSCIMANTCSDGFSFSHWSVSSSGPRSPARRTRPGRSAATSSSRYDTLWSIASTGYADPREGVWEITQRNGLRGATIVPGQVLVLP